MEILGYTIENPYYTNLQTHLLVLLKRNKEKIEEKQQYAIDMNSKEYQAATYIKTEIEKYLDNLLNTYEINYIYSLIVSSRTKYFDYSEEDSPDELAKAQEFVNELIDIIDNQFKKLNFKQDKILEKQLLQHAIPMLKRNRFNIEIKNPLLDSIRKQFSSVYKKIEIATKDLEAKYDLIDITSDEIGYLTLYFQNAIERQNQNINVLIVCSTGIGSSHLLKTRVTNNFSHFHIVGTCSAHELSEYEDQDVDLILSTVRLKNTDKPYLLVSAILNQADINLINRFIDDNYGGI